MRQGFLIICLLLIQGIAQAESPATQPATQPAKVDLAETQPLRMNGLDFQIVGPVVWVVPSDDKSTTIQLGFKVTNHLDKAIQLNLFDTNNVSIKDSAGHAVSITGIRDDTAFPDPLLIEASSSTTIGRKIRLALDKQTPGTWQLSWNDETGLYSQTDGLKLGKYAVSMSYENSPEMMASNPFRGAEAKLIPYWFGKAMTKELAFEITKNPSTQPATQPSTQPAARSVPFDIHDGYFVLNKFEPKADTSFIVIQDQKGFDEVFGTAMVMGDKSNRLLKNAFDTKIVLAAIKRGKATWTFDVKEVIENGGVLSVRYSTTETKQNSTEFACPLIVSVPKGDYTVVEFVEEGKVVEKTRLDE